MTVMGATTKSLDGEAFSSALEDFQILVGYILAMTGGSYLLFDYVWKD